MKKSGFAFVALAAMFFSSCKLAYQVFEVSPTATTTVDSNFVFQNSDVEIGYNFWTNGGKMGYYVYNKTDKPIYVNWDRSHFVLNNVSRDHYAVPRDLYFDNVSIVRKTKRRVYYEGTEQLSKQTSYQNKTVVEVPPMSKVLSDEFTFVNNVYDTKKLHLGCKRKRSMSFAQDTTPVAFRNYVTYSFANNFQDAKVVDNGFYVSKITSLTRSKFLGQRVRAKKLGAAFNSKVFLNQLPYYSKSSFFVDNPLLLKIKKD
jgi:hypothetical protein